MFSGLCLGEYKSQSNLCSDNFKPTSKNFMPLCQNKSASGLFDVVSCNVNFSQNTCSSFNSLTQTVLTQSNGKLWCKQKDIGRTTHFNNVTFGDWCLALFSSRDGLLSQGCGCMNYVFL